MFHTVATFFQLLRRDIYVIFKRIHIFGINFGLIYPIMYALCFLYIEPNVLFEQNVIQTGSVTFVGQLLLFSFIISFDTTITVLFDLIGDRFIDYQCTFLDARLVLIERMVFSSLFCFFLLMPFFPVAKLLFPQAFMIPNASWIAVTWMMLLTACMTSAYHLMAACLLRGPHQIPRLWMRYNEILLIFGGFFTPWYIVYKASNILGYLILLNPMLYVTEGARQALFGSSDFFPLWICSVVMISVTILCTWVACIVFKKRMDHI